jgi:HEAT repeat protein
VSERFRSFLAYLQDETQSLIPPRLSQLSDLGAEDAGLLEGTWPQLSVERRRAIVGELRRLADEQIELTFERVHRIALQDPDAEVRRIAIEALWECEDPGLCAPLAESLLHDPSPQVRTSAARALGSFVLLGEVGRIPDPVLHRIEDSLLSAVREDPEFDVRTRSLESLGYSSRPEVPGLIEAAYRSDLRELKQAALLAMGRSANDRWAPRVTAELNSPEPLLRFEAARAAGELELKESTETLVELLDDVDARVRQAAIWSLGQLGGSRAAVALNRLLDQTEDPEELGLLEDALDHLAFVDGTRDLLIFDINDAEDQEP